MSRADAALTYAKEVYAACATVGFVDGEAIRLKRLVDRRDAGHIGSTDAELVAVAQAAHTAAVAWASRN
jgi:hypothetical protein